jgi:uncharacterized protein (TIGR03435 family)
VNRVLASAGPVLLLVAMEFGQSAGALPEFEVANVQASKPGTTGTSGSFAGDRFQLYGATMRLLITYAYDVPDEWVTGAPKWLDTDRFDIVAKAPPTSTEAERRSMVQTLLVQRFRLAVRREDKEVPVYALTLGKSAPKLKETDGVGNPQCKMQAVNGLRTYTCHNMSMTGLAQRLRGAAAGYLDEPVIDLTGLKGSYDFVVAWSGIGKTDEIGGLSVFGAVGKQLGLNLTKQKHSMSMLVVDHVNQIPTEQ